MRAFLPLLLLLGLSVACTAGTQQHAEHPQTPAGPIKAVAVGDADFGRSAYQLLLNGEPSPERTGLLVGVVQRQLARAAERFAAGRPAQGLAALTGALYLC